MAMMYLLLVLSAALIRFFAGYDSRFQSGRYITVKNTVLSRILTDSTSFFERTKRPRHDRGRMSVAGLVYYAALAAVIAVNAVFLILPPIPSEPWFLETSRLIMYADTLGDKISAAAIGLLMLSVLGYMVLGSARAVKTIKQRPLRFFISAFVVLALFALGGVGFHIVRALVFCFV